MELIFEEVEGDVLVVLVDGGLDSTTSGELDEAVGRLIDTGLGKVVLDCEKLDFISSRGLTSLLLLHKRASKMGGDVKLANVHHFVADVLRTMHLDKVFSLYPDVAQARLAFRE